jgi:tetratricopeptide (TPR) repeat protein
MMEPGVEVRSDAERALANQRTFRRLVLSIGAGDGRLNLLVAVCDRPVESETMVRRYEAELGAKGTRCYRVRVDRRFPSLKQSLLELQAGGAKLGAGAIVTVLGISELLDLRLGEERSSLENLFFSLQWTREALLVFECPIVLWMSNKVADGLAKESPDFWSWRGNGLFEFESEQRVSKELKFDGPLLFTEEVKLLKPDISDEQSELGRKAAAQWLELEALLASEPESPLLARLYQSLGFTERDRGNWNSGESVLKRAIQLYQKDNNRAGEARCFGVLGDIERDRGNWDEAERLYRQSLLLREELGDRSGMATSWGLLGGIECNRGNWDEAERLYRQSLLLREELGDRSGMASSWASLGYIERNRGNWDEAERLFRQCLAVEEELGNRSGMATSWGVLGDIERNRGNWDEAERLYRQCLAVEEELGDRSGMASSIGCLGENELGRGNFDAAESLFAEALTQMQSLGMTWHIAETNYRLMQLHHTKNNSELAQQHYNTAHQLFTQLGAAKDLEKIEQDWNNANP